MNEEIRCIANEGKTAEWEKEWMGKWWLTFFKFYTVYVKN